MKVKITMAIVFAGLIILSCKKEEKQPSSPSNTGGGGGGGNNNPTPSNATSFNGIFTTFSYSMYTGPFPSPMYVTNSANAYFSATPQPSFNAGAAIPMSYVVLNGDSLLYSGNNYPSPSFVDLSNENWSVNGGSVIPTFTFSNNSNAPYLFGTTALPLSISKSAGVSISGLTLANFTQAYFTIIDAANAYCAITFSTSTTGFSISPSQLTALATCTNGNVWIQLDNIKAYQIGGKQFQFNRSVEFSQPITINP
jgi:hypothetical protein